MTDKKISKSNKDNWKEYYRSRDKKKYIGTVDLNDFRNFTHKLLIRLIEEHLQHKGDVIEVGAGDSELLLEIAQRFDVGECWGLDYLQEACGMLAEKAKSAGVEISVVCADLFDPPKDLVGRFDFVMSYGVVEHFQDLAKVLAAIGRFSKKDGRVFTLIPNNKKTIYGWLMRKWNIDVYNAHVMYDMNDLVNAHQAAGLEIVMCQHLGSTNFGMLSWCFNNTNKGINFWFYKQLTRISKLIWFIESKVGPVNLGKRLSPYLVCVSKPIR